jgi:hypothetical protein
MKEPKKYRVNIVEWRSKRSISQNSLQHVIYSDISKYLISKGRIEWTEKKVKESLKSKFLGWEQREIIDVVTGEITVKEMLRESSKLDVGEAFHYTTQIIEWAESIGCEIKIPAKCEYREIMERQND